MPSRPDQGQPRPVGLRAGSEKPVCSCVALVVLLARPVLLAALPPQWLILLLTSPCNWDLPHFCVEPRLAEKNNSAQKFNPQPFEKFCPVFHQIPSRQQKNLLAGREKRFCPLVWHKFLIRHKKVDG